MPKGIQTNPEETDLSEGAELPGAIVLDELAVEVVPQGSDEFICGNASRSATTAKQPPRPGP